jgi:hypothetical protein
MMEDEELVERFVPGRELTIGIFGDQALPILEIIPKGGFYDFNNRYPFLNPQAGGGAVHVCSANIDAERTKKIQTLATDRDQSAADTAAAAGISYADLCGHIIALSRAGTEGKR